MSEGKDKIKTSVRFLTDDGVLDGGEFYRYGLSMVRSYDGF